MLFSSKIVHVIEGKSENAEKEYNVNKSKQQSFLKPANMHASGPPILP